MNISLVKKSLFLLLLAGGFFFIGRMTSPDKATAVPVRSKANPYPLVSPLLAYETSESDFFGEYSSLKNTLEKYVSVHSKKSTKISIYFRDLSKGQWISINEKEQYYPASLLKVLIQIAYYKQAEHEPAILSKKLSYTNELRKKLSVTDFASSTVLTVGRSYSVAELIEKMIVDSDNGAKDLLYSAIDSQTLTEFYAVLGLSGEKEGQPYTISPETYSYFFRVLYNATFLNAEYSNRALETLTHATFSDGLVAGIPKDVKIAHKFGERIERNSKGELIVELHDCGIIYAPQTPYLLCVMTHGDSLETNATIIKEISSLVYDEVVD
jgi:beta-lactamase class A